MKTLSPGLQEAIVALVLYDSDSARFIKSVLPANSFDVFYADIVADSYKFLDSYGESPKEHDLDIFDTIKARRKNDVETLTQLQESIAETAKGVNKDFVLGRINLHVRYLAIRNVAQDIITIYEKEFVTELDIQSIENKFAESNRGVKSLDEPGTHNKDTEKVLSFLNKEHEEVFPTGIGPLDERGIGPARKQLYTFMAPTGHGKSWHMCQIAKHSGVLSRNKTLIVTCEMSEEEYWQRMIQCLFSVTKKQVHVDWTGFRKNEDGLCVDFEERRMSPRLSFKDENASAILRKKLKALKANVWIKQFPTGELTSDELESYLSSLEWRHGFIPDLVAHDYPDLQKYDPKHERTEVAQIWRRYRGLGIRRNFAAVAATQPNRNAEGAKRTKRGDVGLAIEKLQVSDTFITMSRTKMEEERGLARIEVAKCRHEQDGFQVIISQAYAAGQFCMDAVRMQQKHYMSLVDPSGKGEE